jgi:hypothetical protein
LPRTPRTLRLCTALLIAAGALLAVSCDLYDNRADERPVFEITAPAVSPSGRLLPVAVRAVRADGSTNTSVTGRFPLEVTKAKLPPTEVSVKRGRGSVSAVIDGKGEVLVRLRNADGQRALTLVDAIPQRVHTSIPSAPTVTWEGAFEHVVLSDLTVPVGTRLMVEPGARVVLGPRVNLFVRGEISIEGTADLPVVFTEASEAAPWGGIELIRARGTVAGAFFTQGGADDTRQFGHSESQPVIKADRSDLDIEDSYIIDNPGKALGVWRGRLNLDRSLISRCDTGGEFSFALVHVRHSHVLDIPNDDGIFVDDDNDGFYFWNVHESGEPSKVEYTHIITGKDDGIDHNEARLEINHSWIEDFMHEGVAGSSANWVRVFNTVVRGCEQGIEAGYGSPNVFVDHCVVVGNKVGIRFGDSYDWGCTGRMTVTNTIVADNQDNVLNFDLKTGSAVEGAITISHTMTNDADYDGCPGCTTGRPRFDSNFFLRSGSPGTGAAQNGNDLGLIPQPPDWMPAP